MATLESIVDGLRVTTEGLVPRIAYEVNFAGLANNTVLDGNEIFGDRTWLAENIASRTTLAEVSNGVGIVMTHLNGVSSEIAGADTAPRVSIALSDLLTDYDPRHKYFFFVNYSWAVVPDAAGERFSIGILGAQFSPGPSAGLRFAGATANYNSTAAAVVHEGERTNTITNSQTPEQTVLGMSLENSLALAIWQSTALPDASLANLTPVVYQQATNLVAGGNYELFNFSQGRLTLALAATGSAAVHQVQIAQMRVIEV